MTQQQNTVGHTPQMKIPLHQTTSRYITKHYKVNKNFEKTLYEQTLNIL